MTKKQHKKQDKVKSIGVARDSIHINIGRYGNSGCEVRSGFGW